MSDTVGSLVDKLFTIDSKMWDNQELLYKIRKMSFEKFKKRFFTSESDVKKLWQWLKKACDLNLQRSQLIDEIDEKIIEIVNARFLDKGFSSEKYLQPKHKTY